MTHLDDLRTQVRRIPGIRASNKAYIEGLLAKIEELKTDPVEIQALVDETRAELDGLLGDIEANNPNP